MGPLAGYKVVELAGIGPGPMCAMLLSDMGAEVLRIDRTEASGLGISQPSKFSLLNRGRRSAAVDLKQPQGVETVLRLVEKADALIEGFRPGVTERLGLGPDDCLKRNPKLVYGRMTGWGQDGPMAHAAGHDLNYIALTGALHAIGRRGGPPVPPLNLVGDFGGGALYLAFGIVCAILEAQKSGKGQVVDAAMTDGAASLMTAAYGMKAMGIQTDERGTNILDSGAHFYDVYQTSDGKYVSIASIEAKFYAELLEKTGLDKEDLPKQMDKSKWPDMKERLAAVIKTKTRDEWCAIMEGSDVCFAPVLSLEEAPNHPHNKARQTFIEIEGVVQPAAAPRFSRTRSEVQGPAAEPGQHTEAALADWGFAADEIAKLREAGAVA
ncbi:MAG: CoA transferase [Minwuiales bacterium]|nr:CoA transferase [Minwuiales bacterium]